MPFEVLEIAKIYSLIQVGVSHNDISDTKTYIKDTIIDLRFLLNPFIIFVNIFKKVKLQHYKQYKQYTKEILKQGMPGFMADALLEFHKEVKLYEADEMEKSTKKNNNGRF